MTIRLVSSRLGSVIAVALLAASTVAPSARARLAMQRCTSYSPVLCGTVVVPLDRTGIVGGTVRLHVERVRAKTPTEPPLFFFSGGPGQAADDATGGLAQLLGPALHHRDLVVFDQRGTGLSGALNCPALERADPDRPGGAPAACAARLGWRRSLYTTADSVADIDAVRAALGYRRVALFGISYGTKVVVAYARAYPQRLERLIVDSVVGRDAPDPLSRHSFRATARILRSLCGGACRSFTKDPAADLGALVARMSHGDLAGPVYGAGGRARIVQLDANRLFETIFAGDLDPTLRGELPADLRAAVRGDPTPLLRLVTRGFPPLPPLPMPKLFSATLFTATTCEELPFPWNPSATPAERAIEARLRVDSMPASWFAPFDGRTALSRQLLTLCRTWPGAGERFVPDTGPLPDVPALVINGSQDVRTPLEDALAIAAQLPRARTLVVPGAGHSVVGTDESGCAARQLVRFLDLQRTGSCRGHRTPIAPPPPRRLSALIPIPGVSGRRGRAVRAAVLTAQDTLTNSFLSPFGAGGGLRGGSYRFRAGVLELARVVYVPGVRVSGSIDLLSFTAHLRFSGAAGTGNVQIGHGLVTGTVSGRGVHGRARLVRPSTGRGAGSRVGEGPTGPWPVT